MAIRVRLHILQSLIEFAGLPSVVQAWSEQGFRNLMSLDVSHNEIITIAGQGLPFMRNLAELNLSFNHLKSLEDTLIELEQCPALEVLFLQVGGALHCLSCAAKTHLAL